MEKIKRVLLIKLSVIKYQQTMSNTTKHKNKGKFNNGLLKEIPRDLENMFDRWNWDVGEFRKAKKDLEDKIAEKEMKKEIKNLEN